MKRNLLVLFILVLSSSLFAKDVEKVTQKTKWQNIEIFDEAPKNRKFQKLTPVMGTCTMFVSLECAMKAAKRQAAKAGADAIIDVKVSSAKQSMASYGGGVFAAGSDEKAVVNGWAIKWTTD